MELTIDRERGSIGISRCFLQRVLIVFLIFIVSIMPLSSCNTTKETNASDTRIRNTGAQVDLRGLVLPLSESGATLRIATANYEMGIKVSDELPVFEMIRERTGISIIWETVDLVNYATVIQSRISAGVDLPDMFQLPGDPVDLAEDKIIIPLEDLIEEHAPNMKFWFNFSDDIWQTYTLPDGHLYSIPQQFYTDSLELARYNNIVLMLREDWLNCLRLDIPKTADDLYIVLRAFKESDPNRNNKADEIPFSGAWSGLGINTVMLLSWMFGLHPVNDGIYPDSNGVLTIEWHTAQMKEFLSLLNKWYIEGLIDPDFINLNYEKWLAQLYNGISGVTFWFNMAPMMGLNNEVKKSSGNPDAAFIQIPTPSAEGYEGIIECLTEPYYGHFSISRDCGNPELAIKWLDYAVFSEDGVMYNYFGIEGLSFEYIDGIPVLKDSITNAPEGEIIRKAKLGMEHHNSIPILVTSETLTAIWGEYYPMIKMRDAIFEQIRKTPRRLNVMPTREEADRQGLYTTDLTIFRNEHLLKFITGEMQIEEFDKYVNTLIEIGMFDMLNIKQEQYERIAKQGG